MNVAFTLTCPRCGIDLRACGTSVEQTNAQVSDGCVAYVEICDALRKA